MLPSQITTDVTNAASSDHPPSPTAAAASSSSVLCSICIEPVIEEGDRSVARLPCGHRFHLDCIGSAFNSKGAMQCPNCRRIETGRWLYANGSAGANSQVREWVAMPHELAYPRVPTSQWRQAGGFSSHSSPEEMEGSSNVVTNFGGNYIFVPNHAIAAAQASNFHHPMHIYQGPSIYVHSSYIHQPTWGNPQVRLTYGWPQPIYYNTPRLVSRETPMANSQLHERNQMLHQIPHAARHHEQPTVFTFTPYSASLVISGGGLLYPITVPNLTYQLNYTRMVHGAHNNESERDESAYGPVIRGTYNYHHRP